MEKGMNWGSEATGFGRLARVRAADWSPGDSRCRGPSVRLSPPHAPPPSRPLSSSLCRSLFLPHCFLSPQLGQLMFHLRPYSKSSSFALPLSLSSSSSFCSSTLLHLFSGDSWFLRCSLPPSNSLFPFPHCWEPTVLCSALPISRHLFSMQESIIAHVERSCLRFVRLVCLNLNVRLCLWAWKPLNAALVSFRHILKMFLWPWSSTSMCTLGNTDSTSPSAWVHMCTLQFVFVRVHMLTYGHPWGACLMMGSFAQLCL